MKRKTLLLFACCVTVAATVFAQNRLSGGISAGANYSWLDKDNVSDIDFKGKFGAVGGLWLNFPVSSSVSIQPSVLYSQMGTKIITSGVLGNAELKQRLAYISVPVALKFNAGNSIAFLVGPQFDFLAGAKLKDDNDNETKNEDDFEQFDFALTGGIQFMPNSPFSITA